VKIGEWDDFPPAVRRHLQQRVRERKISISDLQELAGWIGTKPDVPIGEWYKRFATFTVCGEGSMVKTVLEAHHEPYGTEM
jgi:hypothetical protein